MQYANIQLKTLIKSGFVKMRAGFSVIQAYLIANDLVDGERLT